MKFNCGPTYTERKEAKEKWHEWFAWHPVRLGSRDCRWLERIERKGYQQYCSSGLYWTWSYREIENDQPERS